MTGRVLRFLLIFGGGLLLVWFLAVGPQDKLFGPAAQVRRPPAAATSGAAPTPVEPDSVAFENARIPIRADDPNDPDKKLLKYEVLFASSVGRIAKQMNVREVRIDIYNGKGGAESRVQARVSGDRALLVFPVAPDPHEGFRDVEINAMTLTENVVVEYLADDGQQVLTTLTCEHLDLDDDRFAVKGRSEIVQQGMFASGDDLIYDKVTRAFSFERDVTVRGSQFRLPGAGDDKPKSRPTENQNGDESVDAPAPSEKVITCRGRFSFVPDETPGDGADESSSLDPSAVIGGGLLTFEDEVRASQDDTVLLCDRLEITLEKVDTGDAEKEPDADSETSEPPPPDVADSDPTETDATGGGEGDLQVSRMFAYGSPGNPARLTDPRGNMIAERISMRRTEAGQLITLLGDPSIEDARLGNSESAAVVSASCAHEIQFVPRTREQIAELLEIAPDDPSLPANAEFIVLELRDNSSFRVTDPDPKKSLDLSARDIDLLFFRDGPLADAESDPGDSAGDGQVADDAGAEDAGAEGATSDFSLLRLLAKGDAVGTFSGGEFRGQRIVSVPRGDSFEIEITPDPRVRMLVAGEQGEREITLHSDDGRLVYTPPANPDEPVDVVFHGKTHVEVMEDGALATALDAMKEVSISFAPGAEQGLSELVAIGDVTFDSPANQVSGHGDRLVLLPGEGDQQKVFLYGSLASARMTEGESVRAIDAEEVVYDPATNDLVARRRVHAVETQPGKAPRTIDADELTYDPATGVMHAMRHVVASMGDFAGARSDDSEAEPGELRCEDLRVTTRSDESIEVIATGGVDYFDVAKRVQAVGDRLHYVSRDGLAKLYGQPDKPARVVQNASGRVAEDADASGDDSVLVKGAELYFRPDSAELDCPANGLMILNRKATAAAGATRVTARSLGPISYRSDRLVLNERVVVSFEEDRREMRALWCDRATVHFVDESATDQPAGSSAMPGVDRIVAVGRVHLEQKQPRALVGEGQSLEWRVRGDDEVMTLKGLQPRAWIEGLLSDRDMRYEADSFVLHSRSEEFQAENGVLVFSTDS